MQKTRPQKWLITAFSILSLCALMTSALLPVAWAEDPKPQTLEEQLILQQEASKSRFTPDQQRTIQEELDKLSKSGLADHALKVDDYVQDFNLPDQNGKIIRLSDLLAKGPVVLTFYRGQWCPYCNLALHAMQAILPQIQAEGASLVAISPQTPDKTMSTAEKDALQFEVLSDVGNKVAHDFGIVFQVSEPLRNIQASLGLNLPDYNGDDSYMLPAPATYIIAPDGSITYAYVNVDYRQRANPDAILAALRKVPKEAPNSTIPLD